MGDTRTTIDLGPEFLSEVGMGTLDPSDANSLLAHCYETLELRVGMRLAEQMSDVQLDEFEAFINDDDEAGALAWLQREFPRYRDVVHEEYLLLKAELTAASGALLTHFAKGAA